MPLALQRFSIRARLSVYRNKMSCNKVSGLVSHAYPDSHAHPCMLHAQLAYSLDLVFVTSHVLVEA